MYYGPFISIGTSHNSDRLRILKGRVPFTAKAIILPWLRHGCVTIQNHLPRDYSYIVLRNIHNAMEKVQLVYTIEKKCI